MTDRCGEFHVVGRSRTTASFSPDGGRRGGRGGRGGRDRESRRPAPPAVEVERLELCPRGTTEISHTEDWKAALDACAVRNAGRRVRLEVDDPDIGAQVQESGFALLAATYHRKDRSVERVLRSMNVRRCHVTRAIHRADDLAMYATRDGKERALRVARGRSHTLITFLA